MNILSDSFYEIGHGHSVCQDYTLHKVISINDFENHIIILSDGCSSSQNTEVGCKILARAFSCILTDIINTNPSIVFDEEYEHNISQIISNEFKQYCLDYDFPYGILNSLDLNLECLDATIWILIASKNIITNKVEVFVIGFGDGELIVKRKNSTQIFTDIYYVNYPSNAPYYINYLLDQKRQKQYLEQFQKNCIHGFISDSLVSYQNLETEHFFSDIFSVKLYQPETIISATICSDGLLSYNINNNTIQEQARWSLNRLVDFKNSTGPFLERRMRYLARKDLRDKISHFDDISAAGALIQE